jgi:alcohol dehydrogenase
VPDVVEAVRDITKGGAHVSIDALGHPTTCFNSIKNLRRRGRHVQVGLMLGEHATPQIPMAQVIGHELEIYGSHGMQAWRYDAMLAMITSGKMEPRQLISKRIGLQEAIPELMTMDKTETPGIAVITSF